jgi:hypothetical protein
MRIGDRHGKLHEYKVMASAKTLCIFPIAGMVGYANGPRWVAIGDVTFVSWATLSSAWRELGFPSDPAAHLCGEPYQIKIDLSDVVGVISHPTPATEAVNALIDRVLVALKMLLACNSPWGPGGQRHGLVAGAVTRRATGFVYAQDVTTNGQPLVKVMSIGPSHTVRLDGFWKKNKEAGYYNELNDLLSGAALVEDDWKARLLDSAELLGHSRLASTPWEAFLFSMIGMERLLKSGASQKWRDGVANNVEALFSWLSSGKGEQYVNDIRDLYALRNKVAHLGRVSDVSPRSAKIADEVLFNLLLVSFKHLKEVKSLDELTKRGLSVAKQVANGEKQTALPNAVAIYGAFGF